MEDNQDCPRLKKFKDELATDITHCQDTIQKIEEKVNTKTIDEEVKLDIPFTGKELKENKELSLPSLISLFRFADTLDILLIMVGTLGALASGGLIGVYALVYGLMIDDFAKYGQGVISKDTFIASAEHNAFYFLLIAASGMIASYFQAAFWMMSSERQAEKMRKAYISSLLRQSISWYDTKSCADHASGIARDTEVIGQAIGLQFGNFVKEFGNVVAGLAVAFVANWKLTLVMLAVSPALSLSFWFFGRAMALCVAKEQEYHSNAGTAAQEAIESIRTVFAFGGQDKEVSRYTGHLKHAFAMNIQRGRLLAATMASVYFFVYASYALGFWFGAWQVSKGNSTPGYVVTAFFGAMGAGQAVGRLHSFALSIAKARGSALKVFQVVDLRSEVDSFSENGIKPGTIRGDICFKDLSFAYPSRPNNLVLNKLNLKILEGSTVALVGPSGCGKSSIVNLIERFYLPTSGSIRVGGNLIDDFNVRHLRERIGYVGQEPVLFSMSIKDNILLANPSASFDEVIAAAKKANAYEFIDALPQKFETEVGEGGKFLSGGQKQRIAIARAVLRKPNILILDEATSALDSKSESVVQKALEKASLNTTTIIIAHRLATIKNADHIVVLDKGSILEIGNHESLIKENGIYASMVRRKYVNSSSSSPSNAHSVKEAEYLDCCDQEEGLGHSIRGQSDSKNNYALSHIDLRNNGEVSNKKSKQQSFSLGRLFSYNKPEIVYLLGGSAFAAIMGAQFMVFAFLFSEMLGVLSKPANEIGKDASFWACMLFVISIGTCFVSFMQTWLLSISGTNLAHRLRVLTFQHILNMDISWFDQPENGTGALTTRLASDATVLEGAFGEQLAIVISTLSSLLSSLVLALFSGPLLALVVIGTVPIIVLAPILQAQLMMSYTAASHKVHTEAGALAGEGLSSIRTIVSLGCEKSFVSRYSVKMKHIRKDSMRKANICGISMGLGATIGNIAFALGFWQGALMVAHGRMEFVNVLKVITAITFTKFVAENAAMFASDYTKAKVAVTEIFDLLDLKPRSLGQSPALIISSQQRFRGLIEFKDVHFRYPRRLEQKILNGISFVIYPGEKVAIVGGSGCGKSTIISLLERYYDPEQGQILIDGIDLKDLDLGLFRQTCGHVGQEPVLFSGTIEENIAYGKIAATKAEVISAAKDAQAHEFIIHLSEKYSTCVGDKGVQLSGGQKQRVAIARALIRKPSIVLLDEATSALDGSSEAIVQGALDAACRSKTTIVVAHRLSTIQHASKILVMDEGEIVDIGSHEELLENPNGVYAKLIAAQLR